MTGLFKKKTQEEQYLEIIAKVDKRLVRDKKLLVKSNNQVTTKLLENNIKMMENTRTKFTNLLADYRNNVKSEKQEILEKCEFCSDIIERKDFVEHNSKYYHSWCKEHIDKEGVN